MTASTARSVQKLSNNVDFGLGAKLDYGGQQLIKQDNASKAQQDSLAAQQNADAADAGTEDTQNADTRKSTLQYAADSAGATRTGNDADTVSGNGLMSTTKKKSASRDLGMS